MSARRRTTVAGPSTPAPVQHALVGHPDDTLIPDADWPAYSTGYEAGLRDGIAMTRLQIRVELVPVGPANAGIRLWRALTHARLTHRASSSGPRLSGEQVREQARVSWGLTAGPTSPERDPRGEGGA